MNLSIECYIETTNKIGKAVSLIKVFTTVIVARHPTNSHRENYMFLFISYVVLHLHANWIFKFILVKIKKQFFLKKRCILKNVISEKMSYLSFPIK